MKKKNIKTEYSETLDSPRVRFNWGYWDGAAGLERGREPLHGFTEENILEKHFDKNYAQGWIYGRKEQRAGLYNINGKSDRAWAEFQAAQQAVAA